MQYIERDGTERFHSLDVFPDRLSKKVTLVKYFRNYMSQHLLKVYHVYLTTSRWKRSRDRNTNSLPHRGWEKSHREYFGHNFDKFKHVVLIFCKECREECETTKTAKARLT